MAIAHLSFRFSPFQLIFISDTVLWETQIYVTRAKIRRRLPSIKGAHFTPEGWRNIIDKFYAHTGRQYTKAHFKNQWNTMKSEYMTFNELMHRETGIRIDPITNTIDAPVELWERKIKEHEKYRKFRGRDVSIFQHEYHNLFSGILAIGFILRCPIRFSQVSGTETSYGQEGFND
ncbi:Myb DNA-bind 3 domain-containing protein [Abeliophyllum distichum]|uniref:Myb DNA-bind 3 domain-containing protein n=1 Tax=Abeliophyllum distichum TaxID=126358 RepID=A0ABD1T0E9_9LAMI